MFLWSAANYNWWFCNNFNLKLKMDIKIKEASAGCTEVSFICQNISKGCKIIIYYFTKYIITLI